MSAKVQSGQIGADLSDAQVASRVRMLMRDDLDHEMVCVMARDRIRHLSSVCSESIKALEIARNFIAEELACREQSMLPESSKDDGMYIASAREALRVVNSAIRQADGKESA